MVHNQPLCGNIDRKQTNESAYHGGVRFVGVVFLGDQQEQYPIPQLDAAERGDAHVEEDPEESCHWNHLQDRLHEDGQAWNKTGVGRVRVSKTTPSLEHNPYLQIVEQLTQLNCVIWDD